MLCERLFGLEPDPGRGDSMERNSTTQALHDNVIAGLSHRGGGIEQDTYSAPWFRMKIAQVFVARGFLHVVEQLRVVWTVPTDRAWIALPRPLSFVHHLIRVPVWLIRTAGRLLQRFASGPLRRRLHL
jgi:hypothetical protein